MPKFKQLTKQQRISAFSRLQGAFKDGKLPHGEITKVAKIFGVTPSAISHLWRAGGGNTVDTLIRSPEFLKKTKRSGPVSKYDLNELREAIRKVPLRQRTCIRDLAAVLGIPKSTLHELMKNKQNGIHRHTSAVKPLLTPQNKIDRVVYAASKVAGETFIDMEDEIHVDEKWFYLTRVKQSYILVDGEEDPGISSATLF